MIYLVIYPNKYVAAVVKDLPDLVGFLNKVPAEILSQLRIEPTHCKEYPMHILESRINDRIWFIAEPDKTGLKRMTHTVAACDGEPLITYDIKENFFGEPGKEGQDFMGLLSHTHLTED